MVSIIRIEIKEQHQISRTAVKLNRNQTRISGNRTEKAYRKHHMQRETEMNEKETLMVSTLNKE